MEIDKRFFGGVIPKLDIDKQTIEELASRSVNQGLTVPGVQKKLSLHLSKTGGDTRLTLMGYPTGYILKPQTDEYPDLPEAEDFAMTAAKSAGLSVVPFGLIRMKPNGEWAYITRRIDRGRDNIEMKYAMEDFCQLSQRLTEDKYKGSYEQCAKIIKQYSERPGIDLSEFFMRVIFSFMIGNSDMHLKNLSLIEQNPGRRDFILSPAYDMLNVNVVNPEDTDELALSLCGKKSRFKQADFIRFADSCGISEKAADKMIRKLVSLKPAILKICTDSYMSDDLKAKSAALIDERSARLSR